MMGVRSRRGAVLYSPMFFLAAVFLACAPLQLYAAASCSAAGSTDEIIEFANTVQQSRNEVLLFSTVSRKADRSSEEFLALYQAAEQVAMMQGILVKSSLILFDTGSRIDYAGRVDVDFGDPSQFLDQMTVVRTLQNADGTYMVSRWDAAPPSIQTPRVRTPDWIRKPPEQAGFLFAVGTVQRRTLEDFSFREADQQAFAELSNTLLNRTYEGTIDLQTGGFGYAAVTEQKSEVFIRGARIIARWRDAEKQNYYSLAVCPVPE